VPGPAGHPIMQGAMNKSPSRTFMRTPTKKNHASHSLEPRNTSVVVTSLLTGSTNAMPQILKKSHNELPPHYGGTNSGGGNVIT